MFDRIVKHFILLCLALIVLSGCTTSPMQHCCLPVGWEDNKDDRQDFPSDFPKDSVTQTDRDLDIVIIGEGFFQCVDESIGEHVYTRHGHFNVDHSGRVVFFAERPDGFYSYPLEPWIVIPPNTQKVQIYDDGTFWILQDTKAQQWQAIGMIKLATFAQPEGLLQVAKNLYRETERSGMATVNTPGLDGTGVLKTQYLAVSNP